MHTWLKRRGLHYYLCYRLGGKEVRIALHTTDLKVAQRAQREFEAQHEAGGAYTKTPVSEVLDAYVEHIKTHLSAKQVYSTIQTFRDTFGDVAQCLEANEVNSWSRSRGRARTHETGGRNFHISTPIFEEIDTATISDWLRRMVKARGWSPATATKRRNTLSALWNWALKPYGLRRPGQVNPVTDVQTYKVPTPVIRFLTRPQIQAQLEALDPGPDLEDEPEKTRLAKRTMRQVRVMVATYIYAGLRLDEALRLKVDDVELGDGSPGRYGIIRIHRSKTGVGRTVPISSDLYPYLQGYERPPYLTTPYFPSPRGMKWSETNFARCLRNAQQKAKLETKWSCLDFRHTFGSMLAQKGEATSKIASLMGNSEPVVLKHYASLIPRDMVDTVEFGEGRG